MFIATRKSLVVALSALACSVAVSQAHAGAIATAKLDITNLTFFKVIDGENEGDITLGVDIKAAGGGITNVADTRATLNGVTDTAVGSSSVGTPTFDVGTSSLGNEGFSCVGDCSYVNNSLSHLGAGDNLTGGSYAVNDIGLSGSVIAIPDVTPSNASAFVLAESAVLPGSLPGNEGSAQGNVGVSATFEVISQFTGDLGFSFDFDLFLRSALLGEMDSGSALANVNWALNIRKNNGGANREFTLGGNDQEFQKSISTNTVGTDFSVNNTGSFAGATTNNFFQSGEEYTLTIAHTVLADSESVPVPATLALVGVGFVGLGFAARRRNKRVNAS